MEKIRKVEDFILWCAPLHKMYLVEKEDKISNWFNSYDADVLLELNDEEFIEECKEYLV